VEHFVVVLIWEMCRWIDRRFVRSLKQAIPALDELLADPRGTLAGRDFTIGPARRYVTGLILGLLAGLLADGLVIVAFVVLTDLNAAPGQNTLRALLIALIATPILCLWIVYYLLRGGRMILTGWGVELHYGATVVRCPWALFDAPGQPFLIKERVFLPVALAARPFVEIHRNGILQQTAKGNTHQLRFKSTGEAVLAPLYEVEILELGGFLLALGRALHAPLPDFSPVASPESEQNEPIGQPSATVEKDGWIMVRLTRLQFPPFCCNCGSATQDMQEFRGFSQLFRIGRGIRVDGTEHARLAVPVCGACRRESREARQWAVRRVVVIGLANTVVIGLVILLWLRSPIAIACFLFPLAVLGIGLGVASRKTLPPVELERYSPTQGTIAIRFRWRDYGERLVAYLQAQESQV
jgi:hypothetical protein